ncbi:MAG: serine O-acetyltransferase [Nostoc sp. LLA-1]|nr:serine O-acetyltransferase [Cyanocohniella sp. LLY]
MLNSLKDDLKIILQRDPAARNYIEILLFYPGLYAIICYRIAHWLYSYKFPLLPRLISHLSRLFTGIEIHPGAKIGKGVFINHGMGVVIGETAIVGDYTLIYQGVTLGGTGKQTGKRHPTLGKNVMVGTGAKVLGNIQIGDQVRIGANSVVLQDVPSDCTIVGIPGRIVRRNNEYVGFLDHQKLPDTGTGVISGLLDRLEKIEEVIKLFTTHQQEALIQNENAKTK